MNNQNSENIKLKRKKAILMLSQSSNIWDNKLYCVYDFQLDNVIRDCMGYIPRGLGKEPYEYIEL